MAKWTREQTSMLLDLYKQHPHLYDNRNLCYSDKNERLKALQAIAAELEKIRPRTTVRDLKQKIRTIRTQYCVEKHKFNKSKYKEIYSPRLWCYDSLRFLDGVATHNINKHYTAKQCLSDSGLDKQVTQNPVRQANIEPDIEHIKVTVSQNCDCPLTEEGKRSSLSFQSSHDAVAMRIDEQFSPNPHISDKHPNGQSSRNYAFAKFICEELDSIEDREILEDTKWDIQMAIRNALKQDMKKRSKSFNHSFQSIENSVLLSPSPSQSSSSVCFNNGGVKQEEDV